MTGRCDRRATREGLPGRGARSAARPHRGDGGLGPEGPYEGLPVNEALGVGQLTERGDWLIPTTDSMNMTVHSHGKTRPRPHAHMIVAVRPPRRGLHPDRHLDDTAARRGRTQHLELVPRPPARQRSARRRPVRLCVLLPHTQARRISTGSSRCHVQISTRPVCAQPG